MTVPALPTFADGITVHAADLNALVANVNGLYTAAFGPGTSRKPQVALRVTVTSQSIPYSAIGLVNWDTADVNTDGMWVSSAASVITIQHAGTYRMSAQIGATGSFGSGGGVRLYILVNGTVASSNTVGCWVDDYCTVSKAGATLSMLPGATIQIGVVYGFSGYYYLVNQGGCRFSAIRIGPA